MFVYIIEPIPVNIIAIAIPVNIIAIAITVNMAILIICVVRCSVSVSWTAGWEIGKTDMARYLFKPNNYSKIGLK